MERVQRLGLVMLAVTGVTVLTVKYFLPYMTPFVLALLLAAVIDPIVDYLDEELPISRGAAVLIVLLIALAGLVVLTTLLVVNISAELNQLLATLPEYSKTLTETIISWMDQLKSMYAILEELPQPWSDLIQTNLNRIADAIKVIASNFLGVVRGIPKFLFTLMIASIATFFISRDKRRFFDFFLSLVPRRWRSEADQVKSEISTGILGFLRSQMILIGITALLAIVGLLILRVPYAWLLGLLAGVLDLIPMIGPGGVFLPMVVYYTFMGRAGYALAILAVLGLILLVRQLSEPRIVGSNIGLHPLTSLVAIYLGAQFLGISGFILGPLTMVVLKAFFVVLIQPRLGD